MVTFTTEPAAVEPAPPPWLRQRLDRIFPADPKAFMTGDQQTVHEIAKASTSMGGYLAELGEQRTASLDILDFGCGWGGETLWLASRVRSVCGVDVSRNAVERAQAAVRAANAANCRCEWSADGHLPFADGSFDAVLSTNVFEHVMDLDLAFREIRRVLKPRGSLLTRFGPLFYSPHGYHLYWACQVPYAHLLFGLDAIAAMRANRGGSAKQPGSWQELGLNGLKFRDYAASVERTGFEVVRFHPIPVKGLKRLAAAPLIGDLFIFGVDCHIRRPQGRKAGTLC